MTKKGKKKRKTKLLLKEEVEFYFVGKTMNSRKYNCPAKIIEINGFDVKIRFTKDGTIFDDTVPTTDLY
jgi:hypothetical protein